MVKMGPSKPSVPGLPDDFASSIKDALGFGQDVIEAALHIAGFAVEEARSAIEDFFDSIGGVFRRIFSL